MIKVATYNIKNKSASKILRLKPSQLERFEQNVALIKEVNPDIIGLQEVVKEEYEWLKQLFCEEYNFFGEFRGSFGITNEACPIMVKKSVGDVINYGTFSISDDLEKIGKKYFGAFFPRIATYVHFKNESDECCVMNMHADNSQFIQKKTFGIDGPIERAIGLYGLNNQIIIGDMNTGITGPFEKFCDRNDFSDSVKPLGNTYKPLNMALDHILYKDEQMDVLGQQMFTNDGSDHGLIMTKFKSKRG